jgi:hypothetical protein
MLNPVRVVGVGEGDDVVVCIVLGLCPRVYRADVVSVS